ncbi:MAG: hypothetical protein JWM48_1631 [Mycobacterium sp.]|jgi:hypothetical protein|nr:hypothetical protein [Mycobacterium sp.]
MATSGRCPRCGGPLTPARDAAAASTTLPGASSPWECAIHGPVAPYTVAPEPSAEVLADLVRWAPVPVWLPDPLPAGWRMSGLAWVGDEALGGTAGAAVVTALSGPHPLGGSADMLFVAEDPGVGLGARLAGLGGIDAGDLVQGAPTGKLSAGRHPTPVWEVVAGGPDGQPSPDPFHGAQERVALVGEADGCWLWWILHPLSAGLLTVEPPSLVDLRDAGRVPADLVYGAGSLPLG